MTIDEAIKHAEEVAKEKESEAEDLEYSKLDWKYEANQCSKCAAEHRQLAEWLKQLQKIQKIINDWENSGEEDDPVNIIINIEEVVEDVKIG